MKLKDSLYSITCQTTEGTHQQYDILLNKEHFIYKAHFPDEPVTPGVCILQIGKELVEDILQRRLEIKQIKNVKFLSVISPETTPQITYHIECGATSDEREAWNVKILVVCGETPLAKISMTLA